jgi:hypothetical protein
MGDGWLVVFDGPSVVADTAQAVLEAGGCHVQQLGGNAGWSGAGLDRARLLVPEDEVGLARELLGPEAALE